MKLQLLLARQTVHGQKASLQVQMFCKAQSWVQELAHLQAHLEQQLALLLEVQLAS